MQYSLSSAAPYINSNTNNTVPSTKIPIIK